MIDHLMTYCTLGLRGKIRLKSSSELDAYEKGYFSATALYNLNIREDQIQYLILSESIRFELGLSKDQSWMAKLRCNASSQKEFLQSVLEKLKKVDRSEYLPGTCDIEGAFRKCIPIALIEVPRLIIFKQILIDYNILSNHYGIASFCDLEFFIRGFRESLEYKNMHEVTGLHDPYMRLFTDLRTQSRLENFIAKRLNVSPISTFGQMMDYYADFNTDYNLFLNCIDGYIGEPRN